MLATGTLDTDYRVPDGLSLDELAACMRVCAKGEIVGVEVAEVEGPGEAGYAGLLDALAPVL